MTERVLVRRLITATITEAGTARFDLSLTPDQTTSRTLRGLIDLRRGATLLDLGPGPAVGSIPSFSTSAISPVGAGDPFGIMELLWWVSSRELRHSRSESTIVFEVPPGRRRAATSFGRAFHARYGEDIPVAGTLRTTSYHDVDVLACSEITVAGRTELRWQLSDFGVAIPPIPPGLVTG